MRLADLQRTLFRWVADGAAPDGAEALVDEGALTAGQRVGVYAEMYWLRMRDVLFEAFELLRRALGDARFEVLCAKYLQAHPSTHHDLGRVGQHLSAFLRKTNVTGEPWHADLAALEWARTEAFVAPDAPVLSPQALSTLDAETFTRSRLTATPSVRVLRFTHAVLPVWRALTDGAALDTAPEATPQCAVVWRRGVEVFHAAIDEAEATALEAVLARADLPAVCEPFAGDDEALSAQAAFKAIGSWVHEGMISALTVDAS